MKARVVIGKIALAGLRTVGRGLVWGLDKFTEREERIANEEWDRYKRELARKKEMERRRDEMAAAIRAADAAGVKTGADDGSRDEDYAGVAGE